MAVTGPGLKDLVVPANTSEFHALINAARAHHRAMHGQAADVAAALRQILPDVITQRGGARQGLLGMDAKLAAHRVVKPLMDAAALNDVISRLYVTSYTRYTRFVVNAGTTKPSAFNPDL